MKDESSAKGKEDEDPENVQDQAVESSEEEQQPEEGRKKKQRTGFRDRKVILHSPKQDWCKTLQL